MATIYILTGPQGIGKTRAAARICAALGLNTCSDDWNGETALPDGALALTNLSAEDITATDAVIVSVTSSLALDDLVNALEFQHQQQFAAIKEKWCAEFAELKRPDGGTSNSRRFWPVAVSLNAPSDRHPSCADESPLLRQQAREWLVSIPTRKPSPSFWLRLAIAADEHAAAPRLTAWKRMQLRFLVLRLELAALVRAALSFLGRS